MAIEVTGERFWVKVTAITTIQPDPTPDASRLAPLLIYTGEVRNQIATTSRLQFRDLIKFTNDNIYSIRKS